MCINKISPIVSGLNSMAYASQSRKQIKEITMKQTKNSALFSFDEISRKIRNDSSIKTKTLSTPSNKRTSS
jgi:hypothetical protein